MLFPELHKVKIKEDKTGRPPTPQKVNRQDNSMQMLFVTRTEARGASTPAGPRRQPVLVEPLTEQSYTF